MAPWAALSWNELLGRLTICCPYSDTLGRHLPLLMFFQVAEKFQNTQFHSSSSAQLTGAQWEAYVHRGYAPSQNVGLEERLF